MLRRPHYANGTYGEGRPARRTGGGTYAIARVVSLIVAVVVGLLVLGILCVLLGLDRDVAVVSWIRDAASWLATPFSGIFSLESNRWETALDWGLAAVVYAIIGGLITRALAR
jgi:hypothetical protein